MHYVRALYTAEIPPPYLIHIPRPTCLTIVRPRLVKDILRMHVLRENNVVSTGRPFSDGSLTDPFATQVLGASELFALGGVRVTHQAVVVGAFEARAGLN